MVNKSEAKTEIVAIYKISIQSRRINDSNLSSKGMKRILKTKRKLTILVFLPFSAIRNPKKNSKDSLQLGNVLHRPGIHKLTTNGATEQFLSSSGLESVH